VTTELTKHGSRLANVNTRPVLRIFISSTAIDLRDYREKVRDVVVRLEGLPIAMETFSAHPNQPAIECVRMAAEADAVVCIVAHRYGYVPPPELGGDGERSITWLEVKAAKQAGKPVFAFLVDPNASWLGIKEQDRLITEPPEKTPEIVHAVHKLQEFKKYLERETTRNLFSTEDELAKLVAIAIVNFNRQPDHNLTLAARVWQPLFCHALQPAQHFRGREDQLKALKDWLEQSVTPDRVFSLVAAGGTGKTAVAHEALRQAALSDRAGVFVWSFYEDPHTDAFLRAAYFYFTGDADVPAGGMLERLQLALSGNAPHVLVMDGLERIQSKEDHRRGELEDTQLKRFIRSLAGGKGNARALVTSRFPLVDLQPWVGAGHRSIRLDDLERPVAYEVLRAWQVKGDDAALARLLEPLNADTRKPSGSYHALSVAVLGSYIGNFLEGDPGESLQFSLDDAEGEDPKAKKLGRILEQYASALTPLERDLLARLSLFPRGVKLELIGWIAQGAGDVAGALAGLTEREIVKHLERLKALGLVFLYEANHKSVFSSHPFLREFFRNILGAEPKSVHEFVRAKLAPRLSSRPQIHPSDIVILDQYELFIEQTLLSGRVQEAYDLYSQVLGGYRNLGSALGENERGLRIVERFVSHEDLSDMPQLSARDKSWLINEMGLFAQTLGDLGRAGVAFAHSLAEGVNARDKSGGCIIAQNLANLEIGRGNFLKALNYADTAVTLAEKTQDVVLISVSLAFRGGSSFALGNTEDARSDLRRATRLNRVPLRSLSGIISAECKLNSGERLAALDQTRANLETSTARGFDDDACRCRTLLARLLLFEDPVSADAHLREARAFANRSGDVELQLRCFVAASELSLRIENYSQALAEAESGIMLADTCGFGKYSIDLRIMFAASLLEAGEPTKALQTARNALDRSERVDCQFAWGRADALHYCGMSHLRLNERELAMQRLTAALALREQLGHGSVGETRRALELCTLNQ
jgi:tetratricopeptide (TPR) repeat protein